MRSTGIAALFSIYVQLIGWLGQKYVRVDTVFYICVQHLEQSDFDDGTNDKKAATSRIIGPPGQGPIGRRCSSTAAVAAAAVLVRPAAPTAAAPTAAAIAATAAAIALDCQQRPVPSAGPAAAGRPPAVALMQPPQRLAALRRAPAQ